MVNEDKDCVACKILGENGVCKSEFIAFDECYDSLIVKEGKDDAACEHLFDAFRACIQKVGTKKSLMPSYSLGGRL